MFIELTDEAYCDIENIGSLIIDKYSENEYVVLALPKTNGSFVKLKTLSDRTNALRELRNIAKIINEHLEHKICKSELELFKDGVEYAIKIKESE